ncbi:MAG: tetratricopeptide repeat protein [Myxococcaceae bacterium]
MRRALWATPLLFFVGCFYPGERGKALEMRVDRLAAENDALKDDLQKTKAEQQAQLPKIDQKLAEVSATLEQLDKASRRSDADIGVQVQKTVEDVAQLRGQVETYLYKINELETKLQSVQDDTAKQLTQMKGEQAVKEAEAKKQAEAMARPADKKDFLKLADDKAKAKDFVLARQLYGEWLKKWPKDELAGEAHYGMGVTYADDGKCREALFEFRKVIEEFQKTKSAPDAYLRSSECFAELKMAPESRLALEEVVKSYPKTDAAKTAKAKLTELDKAAKKATPASGKKTK